MATSVHMTPPPISPQAMADLLSTIILLCRGTDQNAHDFWAYICIKPSMVESFKQARDSGSMLLGEYGTIIESGLGCDVPLDVQERMKQEYGVEPDYQEKLLKAIADHRQSENV